MNYEQKAEEFAKKINLKMTIVDEEYDSHFEDDKKKRLKRWRFKIQLSCRKRRYTFWFGQSIAMGGKEPTIYDVLACLTKYDPENFENFCSNYGFDEDSRTAEKVYKAVVKEYEAVKRLIIDGLTEEELDEFYEIA